MKISVCIIARNEDKDLPRLLSSIPPDFEVVLVDTGSTDKTVQIGCEYGAQIYTYAWADDYAAARNYSISKATGNYVLIMDADEELDPETLSQVRDFVAQYPGKAGGVIIRNFIDGEVHLLRSIRLFPKTYHYVGKIHEQVYSGELPANYIEIDVYINHYGYGELQYKEKNKANRYFKIYEKHLAENPNDGYMHYQLGKLHYSLKQYEPAKKSLLKGLEMSDVREGHFPALLVMTGYVLKELGQSQTAEQLISPFIEVYPDFPDLYFLLGLLSMDIGNVSAIESFFLKALQIGETTSYTSVVGTGSFKAAYNLGVYYEVLREKEKAKQYYKLAAHQYEPARLRMKEL